EHLQFFAMLFVNSCDDVIHQVLYHASDVVVALNKAHLDVEHRDFGDVTGGGRKFSTESRSNLEHALKHTDHDLFVELWALGERRLLAKVIEFKHLCPALGCAGDQFGGLDLDKVVF